MWWCLELVLSKSCLLSLIILPPHLKLQLYFLTLPFISLPSHCLHVPFYLWNNFWIFFSPCLLVFSFIFWSNGGLNYHCCISISSSFAWLFIQTVIIIFLIFKSLIFLKTILCSISDYSNVWMVNFCFFDSPLALAHGSIISCVLSNLHKQFAGWKTLILNYFVLFSNWKDWCWSSSIWATWYKEMTHWTRSWCWEGWKAKGEEGGREWDGWTTSPTQWARIWTSSTRWWRTGSLACCSPWGHQESHTT